MKKPTTPFHCTCGEWPKQQEKIEAYQEGIHRTTKEVIANYPNMGNSIYVKLLSEQNKRCTSVVVWLEGSKLKSWNTPLQK